MQTVDYVVPSDNLLRSIPDFPYLDLVPGMPKLTSHQSLLTNHGRPSGPAVRFQDLFLAFP